MPEGHNKKKKKHKKKTKGTENRQKSGWGEKKTEKGASEVIKRLRKVGRGGQKRKGGRGEHGKTKTPRENPAAGGDRTSRRARKGEAGRKKKDS